MRRFYSGRAQTAVYAGGTDFLEQFFGVFGKLNFFAAFQHFDTSGKNGFNRLEQICP
jgi:hypothetical protein